MSLDCGLLRVGHHEIRIVADDDPVLVLGLGVEELLDLLLSRRPLLLLFVRLFRDDAVLLLENLERGDTALH